MMGVHQSQNDLFTYSVQLDKRVRPDHPLRQIAALVDFSFVRAQTARFYGHNGNVSVDPVLILKLLFLLFCDNIASELKKRTIRFLDAFPHFFPIKLQWKEVIIRFDRTSGNFLPKNKTCRESISCHPSGTLCEESI